MRIRVRSAALAWVFLIVLVPALHAETLPALSVVSCSSATGSRQQCEADTSLGVVLTKSTGSAACLLGKNWGYDDRGIWVSDGCAGEFSVSSAPTAPVKVEAPAIPTEPAENGHATLPTDKPAPRIETWGEFDPGDGFLIGRSKVGELGISGYGLVRYIDQMPAAQEFTDHLGYTHGVDNRNDIFSHRIMVFLKGWMANPKLVYNITFWTVSTTDQKAIFVTGGYQFSRKFSLYAGLNGLPGTRSLQGSHPYWLSTDRVMADEFFRPFFTNGVWVIGEPTPGFWYNAMLGNNSSSLGIKATQLDRNYSGGASLWWMPTTKEFGPKGAYGDWEFHENLATRFGISSVYSPEERFTDSATGAAGNTVIKLADAMNAFDKGALAPGVTVDSLGYRLVSVDAGIKYRGIFLQTELYNRRLNSFKADGPVPVKDIVDTGFYVQAAFYPIPKKLELYAATSQIYGDKSAGFGNSSEYIVGTNFYPFNTRNQRLNVQVIDINHSAVGSTFGFYTAGQNGTTVSAGYSLFF